MKECECEVLIPASVICIFLKYLREREREREKTDRERKGDGGQIKSYILR